MGPLLSSTELARRTGLGSTTWAVMPEAPFSCYNAFACFVVTKWIWINDNIYNMIWFDFGSVCWLLGTLSDPLCVPYFGFSMRSLSQFSLNSTRKLGVICGSERVKNSNDLHRITILNLSPQTVNVYHICIVFTLFIWRSDSHKRDETHRSIR